MRISEIINRANSLFFFFFFCFPSALRALFVAWEAVWTQGEFLTGGGDGKIISVAEAQGTERKEEGKKITRKKKALKKRFLSISWRTETNTTRASTPPHPLPKKKNNVDQST